MGVAPAKLDELDRLGALARTVDPPAPSTETWEERRLEALRKVHTWITVWSEQARKVLTRKDDLQRLGVAKRRSKRGKKPAPAPSPAVARLPAAGETSRPLVDEEEEGPRSRAA